MNNLFISRLLERDNLIMLISISIGVLAGAAISSLFVMPTPVLFITIPLIISVLWVLFAFKFVELAVADHVRLVAFDQVVLIKSGRLWDLNSSKMTFNIPLRHTSIYEVDRSLLDELSQPVYSNVIYSVKQKYKSRSDPYGTCCVRCGFDSDEQAVLFRLN